MSISPEECMGWCQDRQTPAYLGIHVGAPLFDPDDPGLANASVPVTVAIQVAEATMTLLQTAYDAVPRMSPPVRACLETTVRAYQALSPRDQVAFKAAIAALP